MPTSRTRGRAALGSGSYRRRDRAWSRGIVQPLRVKPPSVLEVGVVFVGVCLLLVGGGGIMAFVPTGCGGPAPSPTQRAVYALEDVLYDYEPTTASRDDPWAELQVDYEEFLRRRNNRVNAGVEDGPALLRPPQARQDPVATAMAMPRPPASSRSSWMRGRPLVVMLPWSAMC
ncbi:MAG: hypothetical protein R3F05_15740 [Planctomycetota bacterium]